MKNTSENTDSRNKSGKTFLPYVFISTGDLNGIGPEVILNTVSNPDLLEFCIPVICASPKVILYFRKNMNLEQFNFFHAPDPSKINPKKVNVLSVFEGEVIVQPGVRDVAIQKFTLQSLQKSVEYCASLSDRSILVTGPIDKHLVRSDSFPYSGHTEYLRKYFNADPMMVFINNEIPLRVGLVTGHIPVSRVAEILHPELLENKIRVFYRCLQKDFLIEKPKIALLGLNPHAGDHGTIGKEEQEWILPLMERLRKEMPYLLGPFSADGFFGSGEYKKWDGILAMYHDQGLIPFKTLSFYEGVNYTAGLPIVRTSPDHGPAFSLSGRKCSDERSFRRAMFLGLDILRNRKRYEEMHHNPLPKFESDREEKENPVNE